jgi:sarcosine reductase
MKLTLKEFLVRDVRFDAKTSFREGLLSICREELITLISRDPRIEKVDIDIARPGEAVRITNILEISEPRVKEGTKGTYFPGMLGELYGAGEGVTNVLTGSAVFEIGTTAGFYGGLMDMSGEGAPYTPYSRIHNICILTEPAQGVEPLEYGMALKQAGLQTSVYLARAADGLVPDEVKVFDLGEEKMVCRGLPIFFNSTAMEIRGNPSSTATIAGVTIRLSFIPTRYSMALSCAAIIIFPYRSRTRRTLC